jgi:pSer/pThr/pTyr-binding forkhead associated (FHA) protein
MIDGETLRFSVPSDGPMELLPGRLEIVAGPESGREIRFVRAQGEVDVEVTFGRSEGPPNRHVQILARTVSRRHAIMTLIDDHWQLTNLSSTNPLVLNGRVLAGNEVAPLLVEGDRIEMGEVAFVFHDG